MLIVNISSQGKNMLPPQKPYKKFKNFNLFLKSTSYHLLPSKNILK